MRRQNIIIETVSKNADGIFLPEQWVQVPGYENTYSVSNLGRVHSIRQRICLKPGINSEGYMNVVFCVGGKPKTFRLHRIVAEAFFGRCPLGMEINHKDGDKLNNRLSNLEFVTPKENTAHSFRLGKRRGLIDRESVNELKSKNLTFKHIGILLGVNERTARRRYHDVV